MYHGTNGIIEDLAASTDICLTYCDSVAAEYGENIYEISVDKSAKLANEAAILEAYEEINGPNVHGYWIFELIDERPVRDLLASKGFHGCEYEDATPNNATEHDTVRVWDASVLSFA